MTLLFPKQKQAILKYFAPNLSCYFFLILLFHLNSWPIEKENLKKKHPGKAIEEKGLFVAVLNILFLYLLSFCLLVFLYVFSVQLRARKWFLEKHFLPTSPILSGDILQKSSLFLLTSVQPWVEVLLATTFILAWIVLRIEKLKIFECGWW